MTNTTWPPPWTLKPAEGNPEWTQQYDETVIDGITWDIGFGFTLNVSHADYEDPNTPLTVGAHFSDADAARGFVKREVTPDQVDKLARMLLDVASKQRARLAAAETEKADA